MIKTLFVLVLLEMGAGGGIDTRLTFSDLQQCEDAQKTIRAAVKEKALNGRWLVSLCIKQEIVEKPKKLKCSIENKTDYKSPMAGSYNHNMAHYPYPVSFTCAEE